MIYMEESSEELSFTCDHITEVNKYAERHPYKPQAFLELQLADEIKETFGLRLQKYV